MTRTRPIGRKDIPEYLPPSRQERLEGITVVMDPETETVITSYRNRKGLRDINPVLRDQAKEEKI